MGDGDDYVSWARRVDNGDPAYCWRCDYGRHECRGCGIHLNHGVEVCPDCGAIR